MRAPAGKLALALCSGLLLAAAAKQPSAGQEIDRVCVEGSILSSAGAGRYYCEPDHCRTGCLGGKVCQRRTLCIEATHRAGSTELSLEDVLGAAKDGRCLAGRAVEKSVCVPPPGSPAPPEK
jgi:hypothetical protein